MAALLDYAELEVGTQENDLRLLCLQADKYLIPTVLVNPVNIPLTKHLAAGLDLRIAVMTSYPVGAYFPDVKGQEIVDAISDGADEIYMVMAVGAFIDGWVEKQTIPEMRMLVEKADGRPTKLITEISVLNKDQRRKVCDLAMEAGVDFLVTTTDFDRSNLPPVILEDLNFVLDHVKNDLKIIHKSRFPEPKFALECLQAGVARLCTENARRVLQQFDDFPWA
jgi:deoxyribose-phosphate aldolase